MWPLGDFDGAMGAATLRLAIPVGAENPDESRLYVMIDLLPAHPSCQGSPRDPRKEELGDYADQSVVSIRDCS